MQTWLGPLQRLRRGKARHHPRGQVDPPSDLQVGHHGSDTSSGPTFIAKVQPKYAVISAGKENEGMNKTYCHPRASTVQAVTEALGGPGAKSIQAFDAKVTCAKGTSADWIDVPANDHLWATERDGDVVLTTTGDGTFSRQ
jgi:competence protein ComEC